VQSYSFGHLGAHAYLFLVYFWLVKEKEDYVNNKGFLGLGAVAKADQYVTK
jgi:hypothetical protein